MSRTHIWGSHVFCAYRDTFAHHCDYVIVTVDYTIAAVTNLEVITHTREARP
jgi:hypothetical protein